MFQDCLILRHKKRQKCSRESGVGGARNPDLRITHARSVAHASIAYKYDTLTDCAWWYEECFLSTKLANWNQNSPDGTKTVRDQCYYPRKMKQHFPIKTGQPRGMVLAIFFPFPNYNEAANFGPTSQSGPFQEAVPNILVWRNRNKPFHLTSDRNFRNLRHDIKHALSYFCVWRGFTECRNTKMITLVNDKGTSATIQWTN